MRTLIGCAVIAATTMLGSASAAASLTAYSDRAAFDTAVGSTTLVDFESIPDTNGLPVTVGVVTFNEPSNALRVFNPNIYQTNTTRYLNNNDGSSGQLIIGFSTPVFAVGMDIGFLNTQGWGNGPGDEHFVLNTGDDFTVTVPGPMCCGTGIPFNFVGFTSSVGFTSITINDPTHGVALDNFAFATSAVPVPGAAWLLGPTLAGLGFMRRPAS